MNWPEACVWMVVACCLYGAVSSFFSFMESPTYCCCEDEDEDDEK